MGVTSYQRYKEGVIEVVREGVREGVKKREIKGTRAS